MAQVMPGRTLCEQIDTYLDYLQKAWEGIALDAEEWDEWDEHSRLVFELDWAVPEDHLAQLNEWATQGQLAAAQRARYAELLRLVAINRPILDRMLAE